MGYENTLFNGKSMRNAIITKLSEDKHLTSTLFANSNITILIDIVSYMYQCLVSNLRQAASESMWSDTMFFENAARLAKMIGYYAKGQVPYTLLGRVSTNNDSPIINLKDFGTVNISYGPYDYQFSIVENKYDKNDSIVKLALGQWKEAQFTSDGTKYQEFIIKNTNEDAFISQQYVTVIIKNEGNEERWSYTPTPLFMILNKEYTSLNDSGDVNSSRSTVVSSNSKVTNTKQYNFYINENGDYVLKFGDGLSTEIPPNGSEIYVRYIQSTETDKTITPTIKTAIANASASPIKYEFVEEGGSAESNLLCTPITIMNGYRDKDTAETIRLNSKNAFSRQNRLVTKNDYKSYLLENCPDWKDVVIQNNWEFTASFYGWLYAIEEKLPEDSKHKLIDANNLATFINPNPDLADANNVYIWVLDKNSLEVYDADSNVVKVGIIEDLVTGTDREINVGALKDITVNPIFLYAVCKRFAPCAISLSKILETGLINYNNTDPFGKYQSFFRVHIDPNYANMMNMIKAKTFQYIKHYLFDSIMLGYTPNVPALIKDLMSIDGIINITTVFNIIKDGEISTEEEVNGMQFCTWTDTDNNFIVASEDAEVSYNLPNIPCFQYFKSAQPFSEFIEKSIRFKIDS